MSALGTAAAAARSTPTPNLLGPPVPRTEPALLPPRTALQGRLVTLEPLDVSHADALFAVLGGDEHAALSDYMPHEHFPTRAALRHHLATCAASKDPLFYAICANCSPRATLGWISYLRIEPQHRVIEIGHVMFSKPLQRTAESTEAVFLLLQHAFDDLAYRRLEWKCNSLNAPSRRAAQRYGFVYEGTFRQHMIIKGLNRDTSWYSIIDSDWPTLKKAFVAWLAEDNFDVHNQQVKRLEDFRSLP